MKIKTFLFFLQRSQHMKDWKATLKKIWYFIWEDDSIWSWIVNIALAFVLIKFIVYPGLGFLLQTSHPVVAVVSESMEHNNRFDGWWDKANEWYIANDISKEVFQRFPLRNGFNKGDIMILKGKKAENIQIGDVIVFWSAKKDPIIHRVVKKWQLNNAYYFQTKGDHNKESITDLSVDEVGITNQRLIGYNSYERGSRALFRVPYLGYIKIWAVELIDLVK